ncbi:MAG TPA: hypothetical protein VKD72_08730 [Gemmataceae bacterium]|nr:hypothetical protein [Gemmataceae bacterium]
MQYADYCDALRATHPQLADEFARFGGISDVLAWMQRRDLCRTGVDIVGQDEFHYDFLIQLPADSGWLAVGVT